MKNFLYSPLQSSTTTKAETATTTRQNAMGSCIPAQHTISSLTDNIDWDSAETHPTSTYQCHSGFGTPADMDPYKNVITSEFRE